MNNTSGRLIKRAWDLGLKCARNKPYYQDFCHVCGKEIWHRNQDIGRMCNNCWVASHKKRKTNHGYIMVHLHPKDFGYDIATKDGYVFEHRLVVAQKLGRMLSASEVVHHINGIKTDNRIENLQLLNNQTEHDTKDVVLATLQEKVCELEKQIRLLKWQVKSLQQGNAELNSEQSDKCVENIYRASNLDDDMFRHSAKVEITEKYPEHRPDCCRLRRSHRHP